MTYHDYEKEMEDGEQVCQVKKKSFTEKFSEFLGRIIGFAFIAMAIYYIVTIWYPQRQNEKKAYHKMYELAVSRVKNLTTEKLEFKEYSKNYIEFQSDDYKYDFGNGYLPYKYYVVKVTFTSADGKTESFNVDSYWHYSDELIDGKWHNLIHSDRIWNDECRDIEALKKIFDGWNELEQTLEQYSLPE